MVETRIAPRLRVAKPAVIEYGGDKIPCTIRDISTTGAALHEQGAIGKAEVDRALGGLRAGNATQRVERSLAGGSLRVQEGPEVRRRGVRQARVGREHREMRGGATIDGLRGLNNMLAGSALPRLHTDAIERLIHRDSLPLLGLG